MAKVCPEGKILNPTTNRCVLINGKIGKQLLQNIKETSLHNKVVVVKKRANSPIVKKQNIKKRAVSKKKPHSIEKPKTEFGNVVFDKDLGQIIMKEIDMESSLSILEIEKNHAKFSRIYPKISVSVEKDSLDSENMSCVIKYLPPKLPIPIKIFLVDSFCPDIIRVCLGKHEDYKYVLLIANNTKNDKSMIYLVTEINNAYHCLSFYYQDSTLDKIEYRISHGIKTKESSENKISFMKKMFKHIFSFFVFNLSKTFIHGIEDYKANVTQNFTYVPLSVDGETTTLQELPSYRYKRGSGRSTGNLRLLSFEDDSIDKIIRNLEFGLLDVNDVEDITLYHNEIYITVQDSVGHVYVGNDLNSFPSIQTLNKIWRYVYKIYLTYLERRESMYLYDLKREKAKTKIHQDEINNLEGLIAKIDQKRKHYKYPIFIPYVGVIDPKPVRL